MLSDSDRSLIASALRAYADRMDGPGEFADFMRTYMPERVKTEPRRCRELAAMFWPQMDLGGQDAPEKAEGAE